MDKNSKKTLRSDCDTCENLCYDEDMQEYYCDIDMDEDAYNRYVDQVISRSDVDSGIRPAYGEQLLTLSTCEYSSANGRYVVVARRVSD